MKNLFHYFIIIALGIFTVSCSESNALPTDYSKVSKSYDDFLWKKSKPDTLKAIINTEFSECQTLDEPLILQLCDDDAKAIPSSVAQLYVNGVLSPDNTVAIIPANQVEKTEIWIILDESQLKKDRSFTWNLQVAQNPGLLRINETSPDNAPWIPDTTVYWKNDHVANSLEVTFWSVLCFLAAAFVLFVLFMRLQNPAFHRNVRRLTYDSDGFQKTLVLSGAGRVVFSTKKNSQSFFNRLFTRKTIFVTNDFFTEGDVTVTPKDRIITDSGRRNGARIQARNYTTSNVTVAKGESVDITNDEIKKTITITIN